jgi:hypothetical protein
LPPALFTCCTSANSVPLDYGEMKMADRNSHAKEQSDSLIIEPKFQEYMEHISDSLLPPAESMERFRYEIEKFLNERDLDEGVAVLCAVLVRAIEDATEFGGPKAEESKRAIVAFKKAAALLVDSPEWPPERLAPQRSVGAQPLAKESCKSEIALIQGERHTRKGRSISATIKFLLEKLERCLGWKLKIGQSARLLRVLSIQIYRERR